MWVNNEVGVVQPVAEIAERCRAAGVAFHTDAVQAFGKVAVRLGDVACTLLTISGHKIGAPKGIGALIVRDRKAIEAIIHGGGQQFGIRPGTENVAGAVALGRAAAPRRRRAGDRGGAAARPPGRAGRAAAGGGARPGGQRRGRRAGAPRAQHRRAGGRQRSAAHAPRPRGRRRLERLGLLHRAPSSRRTCWSRWACRASWRSAPSGLSLGHGSTADDVARAAEVMPGVVAKVRKLAGVLGRA